VAGVPRPEVVRGRCPAMTYLVFDLLIAGMDSHIRVTGPRRRREHTLYLAGAGGGTGAACRTVVRRSALPKRRGRAYEPPMGWYSTQSPLLCLGILMEAWVDER